MSLRDPAALATRLVERIAELERVKAGAAAEQARATVQLDRVRREDEAANGVPRQNLGARARASRRRLPWRDRTRRRAAVVTSGLRKRS